MPTCTPQFTVNFKDKNPMEADSLTKEVQEVMSKINPECIKRYTWALVKETSS